MKQRLVSEISCRDVTQGLNIKDIDLADRIEYQKIFTETKRQLQGKIFEVDIIEQQTCPIDDYTDCNVSETDIIKVHNNCECFQRLKVMLHTYQQLMKCKSLWRKIPLSQLFGDIYNERQMNEDFSHVRRQI